MPPYDIAIVGGGMAGASLACHLAIASGDQLRIALVERFALPASGSEPIYQPSFDARSTALSYGTRTIYEQMGLWSILARHISPIDTIHVSDRGHWGSALLKAEEQGLEALGYVVENQWLGRVLLHELQRHAGITVLAPTEVTQVRPQSQVTELELATGESFAADLVVIADGVDSALARQLGIGTEQESYEQMAIITNVAFRKPHQGRAYERFTAQGPMALLPLADGERGEHRAALVWTLPPDQARMLKDVPEADFLQRLQALFGYRQGRFVQVGQRHLYPLTLALAREQIRAGVVVLGNAAHTLHPVAGQGYNLVLRDVAALSELICTHYRRVGRVPRELVDLQPYYEAQKPDQERTVVFSDYLPRLFAMSPLPVVLGRDLGLVLLDLLPPARQRFIDFAAGLAGRQARMD